MLWCTHRPGFFFNAFSNDAYIEGLIKVHVCVCVCVCACVSCLLSTYVRQYERSKVDMCVCACVCVCVRTVVQGAGPV